MVAEAARTLQFLPPVEPTQYADASVAEIAQALQELQQSGAAPLEEQMQFPPGVDAWVRSFTVTYVEEPLKAVAPQTEMGDWELFTPAVCPLAEQLRSALREVAGSGVLVYLPPAATEQDLSLLLQAARHFLSRHETSHFVLVQHGGEGSGLARTLALEASKRSICVIDLPAQPCAETHQWVMAEMQAARGYSEASYDEQGQRRVPRLRLFPLASSDATSVDLGKNDVLLVTGGGKGIAAECAITLARRTGVRLAILGRSKPESDQELAKNLQRMQAAGICYRYDSVDVSHAQTVQQTIQEIEASLGSVTALLHGAGTNVPRIISRLTSEDLTHTFAPKVQGLRNVLAAISPERLRLLVTFGSIIARTGMRGEADYALANDWLARLTETFQAQHPTCRSLCVEWSIWSGVGMGERLGRVDALLGEGIVPIPADEGVELLDKLLRHVTPVRVVVAGRCGEMPTLSMESSELPFLRFLEQPRVYYPGIELVIDCTISPATDPYLEDHNYQGQLLLPGVMGLEAFAQVAMAVTGRMTPHFSKVQWLRPIVVSEKNACTVRIAALVQECGAVELVLRCSETAFQMDHFKALCHFQAEAFSEISALTALARIPIQDRQRLDLEPAVDLYGDILFHQGRFRWLQAYYHLQARECIAEIAPPVADNWFARYLPERLVLGDAARRDATIHTIQACIPHATLLPVGVEKIVFSSQDLPSSQPCFIYAHERERRGNLFTYDVEVRSPESVVLEQWYGLQLQQVGSEQARQSWKGALLRPYLERKVNDLLPGRPVQLVIEQLHGEEQHSDEVLHQLLEPGTIIHRRSDGRPLVIDRPARALSAAHCGQFVIAALGQESAGCDIETISTRSEPVWQSLLGQERFRLATLIATQEQEDFACAATRLWVASESLKKAGALLNLPLVFNHATPDRWILFSAGRFAIATWIMMLPGRDDRVALAVCLKRDGKE
jgi:enediyne polyketide synthase